MIGRRALLAAPFALAVAPTLAGQGVPASGRLGFSIVRKGSEIGTHLLEFRDTAGVLTVRMDVRVAVGFGQITLYRYHHSGVETWRDGAFAEIDTATDDDGEILHVTARREATAVVVASAKSGRVVLPAGALPLTHWNIASMAAPLFNAQDGKPMNLAVAPRGAAQVKLADGRGIAATGFSLTGEATMEDWYDTQNVWAALRATARDGSMLEYRRIG